MSSTTCPKLFVILNIKLPVKNAFGDPIDLRESDIYREKGVGVCKEIYFII
jgi:hypothetical protein